MNLGDFGTSVNGQVLLDFTYFGATIRVHPDFGELDYVDFMNKAGNVETNDAIADGLIKDLMRMCIHPEDFDAFWRLARETRQRTEDIFPIAHRIVAAVSERPTGRPSGSSDGLSRTQQNSAGDDFSAAMAANAGRPDRQLALVRAHEEQVRATA